MIFSTSIPPFIESTAVTSGVRITVRSRYLDEQSSPSERRYVFAYTVRIANEGTETVRLRSRHWVITDQSGHVEEVEGAGVVGKQPTIAPSEAFEYTSGCVLRTPRGTMHGTYQMASATGSTFDAIISPFTLMLPATLNLETVHQPAAPFDACAATPCGLRK